MTGTQKKMQSLKKQLKSMGSAIIAFSGGVDSTFLLHVAKDVLGERVAAVTLTSPSFPKRELDIAIKVASDLKVRHELVDSHEMEDERFLKNDSLRCYYCKSEAFKKITEIAQAHNIMYVLDGQNYDDISDYRPGSKAAQECGVISPLRQNSLCKNEIRALSKKLGIKGWDRPAFACLASRIPYGTKITEEILARIDRLEIFLVKKGFKQVRVRHHGELARIEIIKEEIPLLAGQHLMEQIVSEFKSSGYLFVTLDLEGYRTGSMNIMLQHDIKNDF
ncbi:MAG: ATP-dependent sacrificial sulfur transferase LarE [Actinobacteria bacterium]|nr:ATP-dependent sacrificial sulfur transferase LarE [Actinomycetota bacterium]